MRPNEAEDHAPMWRTSELGIWLASLVHVLCPATSFANLVGRGREEGKGSGS